MKTTVARGRPTPRGRLTLPHDPRKKKEIVLVFAEPERAKDALAAGAAYAGGVELIEKASITSLLRNITTAHVVIRFSLAKLIQIKCFARPNCSHKSRLGSRVSSDPKD